MRPDLMTAIREQVLAVVAHLQAHPVAAARPAAALYLPTLRRFAAGDGMSTDDLHRALFRVEDESLKASDHALCEKATWAANYALLGCSAGHRNMIEGAFRDALASFPGWRVVDAGPDD